MMVMVMISGSASVWVGEKEDGCRDWELDDGETERVVRETGNRIG